MTQKNGHPNHPQTQGRVERLQQTLGYLPDAEVTLTGADHARTSSAGLVRVRSARVSTSTQIESLGKA